MLGPLEKTSSKSSNIKTLEFIGSVEFASSSKWGYVKLLEIAHSFGKKIVEICCNDYNKWGISRNFGISPKF